MDCKRKDDDEKCYCPKCDKELTEDDILVETAPPSDSPPYAMVMKCPSCETECVCKRGRPEYNLKPPRCG